MLEIFDAFGLDHDYRPAGDPPLGRDGRGSRRLVLGRGYINSEISMGSSDELAALLPNTSAWKVWEDPMYEHLGQVHLHHPDLGRFAGTATRRAGRCSAAPKSMRWSSTLARTGSSWDTSPAASWETALEQLEQANRGIVMRADALPASAPLQAIALGQFAGGPARWMPEDAPRHAQADREPPDRDR